MGKLYTTTFRGKINICDYEKGCLVKVDNHREAKKAIKAIRKARVQRAAAEAARRDRY